MVEAKRLKGEIFEGGYVLQDPNAVQMQEKLVSVLRNLGANNMKNEGRLLNAVQKAPTSSTAPGKKGQWFADESFRYDCVADSTWRQIANSTF